MGAAVRSRLELLPDLPLEVLLGYLDGVSALNIVSISELLSESVKRVLSGKTGNKFWTRSCHDWKSDPLLLQVLASFQPDFPRIDDGVLQEEDEPVHFRWAQVFNSAYNLRETLSQGEFKLRPQKALQDQIKATMVMQYPNSNKKMLKTVVSRETGTSGTLAWNLLVPAPDQEHNPETLLVFEDMIKVRRAVPSSQKALKGSSFVWFFPDKGELELSAEEEEFPPLVWRMIVTIGDKSVLLSPVHPKDPCEIPMTSMIHYSDEAKDVLKLNAFARDPLVARSRNYIAIWSTPYNCRIYKILVNDDDSGSVTWSLAGDLKSLTEANRTVIGKLWRDLTTFPENFFFSLTATPDSPGLDRTTFELRVTLLAVPDSKIYILKSGYLGLLDQNPTLECIPLKCYPSNALDLLKNLQPPTFIRRSSGPNLKLWYTSEVLAASRDGTTWHYRAWSSEFLQLNCNKGEEEPPDVTLVEVLAPNLIAIVSGEVIHIAAISLMEELEQGPSQKYVLQRPWIELKIRRRFNPDLINLRKQIKSMRLDFDHGLPYLWIEAERIIQKGQKFLVDEEDPLAFDLYRIDCVPPSE